MSSEQRWEELHHRACERGEEWYEDPDTGYLVFTRLYHLARGHCCDSGCRHCPYRESAKLTPDPVGLKNRRSE